MQTSYLEAPKLTLSILSPPQSPCHLFWFFSPRTKNRIRPRGHKVWLSWAALWKSDKVSSIGRDTTQKEVCRISMGTGSTFGLRLRGTNVLSDDVTYQRIIAHCTDSACTFYLFARLKVKVEQR